MKLASASMASLLIASGVLSGCATITKDANQSVQIETYTKDNQPISGVKCVAQNDRGQWTTTTPGAVNVHRSGQNLQINCEKEAEQPGRGTVVSRANSGMFGNILIGGGIGAIIDHNKGTAYTYPSWLRIVMGDSLVYDRRNEVENSPMTGKNPDTAAQTTASPNATSTASAQ